METFGKRTLERVRRIQAGRIRHQVAELSESEALGLLAGGAAASFRWLILAGTGAGRELQGLARAIVTHRQAQRSRGGPGGDAPFNR